MIRIFLGKCIRNSTIIFYMYVIVIVCTLNAQKSSPEIDLFVPARTGFDTLFYTGALGSIFYSTTPNPGRTHVLGSVRWSNADYTRGLFDGIPEDIKSFAVSPTLSAVFQLYRSKSFLQNLTSTIGTQVGLTNKNFGVSNSIEVWYESNFYGSILAVMPHGITTAVTYAVGTSPNVGTAGDELEIAFAYTNVTAPGIGQGRPSLEIGIPLGKSGIILQLLGNPVMSFFKESSYPFTITFPIRVGAGFSGYYAPGIDFAGFFGFGITNQISIKSIPKSLGSWNIAAGVELIARDDKLAEVALPDDTGGNVLIIGGIGMIFLY